MVHSVVANSYFDALSKKYFDSVKEEIRISGTIINVNKAL